MKRTKKMLGPQDQAQYLLFLEVVPPPLFTVLSSVCIGNKLLWDSFL